MKLGIKKIKVMEAGKLKLTYSKYISQLQDKSIAGDWVEIPIVHLSGTLEQIQEQDRNGKCYSATITAQYKKGASPEALKTMACKQYVFLVTDMNNVNYLVGTNHYRSDLTYSHEIDQLGVNRYTIEITHRSPHGLVNVDITPDNPIVFADIAAWDNWDYLYNHWQMEAYGSNPLVVALIEVSYKDAGVTHQYPFPASVSQENDEVDWLTWQWKGMTFEFNFAENYTGQDRSVIYSFVLTLANGARSKPLQLKISQPGYVLQFSINNPSLTFPNKSAVSSFFECVMKLNGSAFDSYGGSGFPSELKQVNPEVSWITWQRRSNSPRMIDFSMQENTTGQTRTVVWKFQLTAINRITSNPVTVTINQPG